MLHIQRSLLIIVSSVISSVYVTDSFRVSLYPGVYVFLHIPSFIRVHNLLAVDKALNDLSLMLW